MFSDDIVYEDLTVAVSEVKKSDNTVFPAENIKLYREYFSPSNVAEWDMPVDMHTLANALVPMEFADLNKINTKIGENTTYYVKAITSEDTPAGGYSGTVTLTHSAGKIEIPINITVWDFALPKSPYLSSDFLYWRNWADAFYGDATTPAENEQLHKEAIKIFADNRIIITDAGRTDVGYTQGNELEYAKSVKCYMENNPVVTCFPGLLFFKSVYEVDVEKSLALINAYREVGILDKIFYYIVDEPWMEEHVLKTEAIGEFMRTYAPDMWHYCTTFPDSKSYYGKRILDDINLWCSIIRCCNPQVMEEYKAKGSRFWGNS